MTEQEKAQQQHDYYIATKPKRRLYERERYAQLKRLHLCVRCQKQDAYTLNGRARCAECAERNAEKHREQRTNGGAAKDAAARSKRKAAYIADGCCSRCGSPIIQAEGYKMCPSCRAKARRQDAKARIKANSDMNYPRGDNGICFRCNKRPVMEGKRCCGECYAELLQIVTTLQANNEKRKQIENQ